jgi:uncharacterized protein YbjT (DUF2867 family)
MKAVLFGGSGMVGQAILRELLLDENVEEVVSVLRRPTGMTHPKLREVTHDDFTDFSAIEPELTGIDACFFALGVTSAGMNEEAYRRVTRDFAVAAATTLLRLNPQMSFVFVSGAGSDSSERGKVMWARVKGAAENAILAMPFRGAYVVRPAMIQPMHGIRSRTTSYRILYAALSPLLPLFRRFWPQYFTTSERLARAMIEVARHGAPKKILESNDINEIAARGAANS